MIDRVCVSETNKQTWQNYTGSLLEFGNQKSYVSSIIVNALDHLYAHLTIPGATHRISSHGGNLDVLSNSPVISVADFKVNRTT